MSVKSDVKWGSFKSALCHTDLWPSVQRYLSYQKALKNADSDLHFKEKIAVK